MQPRILLLKEGTENAQGKAQIFSNIAACEAIGSIVQTTLGPRGMDKLIHDGNDVTVTNDGATVLRKLNIVHPAGMFRPTPIHILPQPRYCMISPRRKMMRWETVPLQL